MSIVLGQSCIMQYAHNINVEYSSKFNGSVVCASLREFMAVQIELFVNLD